MPRYLLTAVALCGLLGSMNLARADKPLVWRNGIHGREFSEVGRLYLGRDKLLEPGAARRAQHLVLEQGGDGVLLLVQHALGRNGERRADDEH